VPVGLAVLGALLVGAVVGVANGLLIVKARINPLIATLGMMSVARGIALGFTEGKPVINIPKGFAFIGQGSVFGIPLIIIYMLVIVVIADILLRRGRSFRQLYYVGSSSNSARLSGIHVDRVVSWLKPGLLTVLAGVISWRLTMVSTALPAQSCALSPR
jgi:ribose transport system permease protein